jgi:hypothetical protein
MVRVNAGMANPEGGPSVPPGRYHAVVESAVLEDNGTKLKVTFKFLAGTNVAGVGKTFTDWFHFTDKAMGRAFQLAVALGFLTKAQWKQAHEGQLEVDLPLEKSAGLQLCLELVMMPYGGQKPEYQGKLFANVANSGFAMWHVLDEKCQDIPKEPNYYNLALQMAQKQTATTQAAAQAAPGQAPAAAPATSGWGAF